ncbi:Crp/Fnr family transcriptional regulator [Bradyrhizobium sp. Leo121]|uniref:Crp/Fnr family transcriptional regulator n=1 Tax=Bradyrhizobium sp. Leo121 TaxID=1571195 RepID=UPI00102960B7|nr:Crp/Fnr family transcriptional regulator [Bradyrhizobium sp. Leo121]RZN18816.1 Crp/Fnr family transcriptional regulator [Bradyrhizobium sp. Leo121]
MEHETRIENRLLAALPQADLDLLAPHFRNVSLKRDAVLARSGDLIEQIYFPSSGLVAHVMDMPNGQTVTTAIVGKEGAVNILTALGPARSPMTMVVRIAGTALQLSPARFHAALEHSHALKAAVNRLNRALIVQLQHVAACNALHSVEARLAHWLLHIHDRTESDMLPLTQETLSELLGVRRTTVTHVVSKLRASGAIRSNRRSSIEIDRPRLEAAACDCYQIMRSRIERIVSTNEMTPRGHSWPAHERPRTHAPLPTAENGAQHRAHAHGAAAHRARHR